MRSSWNSVMAFGIAALSALGGCAGLDGSDAPQAAPAEASIVLTPVPVPVPTIYMPPIQSVQEAYVARLDHGGLIPDSCKAFQTVIRGGSTLGTFRAFGVCLRPVQRIVFQVEGGLGSSAATTTAGTNDLVLLNALLAREATSDSAEPNLTTGAGGLLPKGGPPQPGGTDPHAVIAVARDLQDAYDTAEIALKEATTPPAAPPTTAPH
jgi:hypothetical protein